MLTSISVHCIVLHEIEALYSVSIELELQKHLINAITQGIEIWLNFSTRSSLFFRIQLVHCVY